MREYDYVEIWVLWKVQVHSYQQMIVNGLTEVFNTALDSYRDLKYQITVNYLSELLPQHKECKSGNTRTEKMTQ